MTESRRYFSEIMNPNGGNTMDTEEDEEEKATIYKEPMRRNLLTVFEDSVPVEVSDERMSVFLRVRPFSEEENDSKENQGCVEVQNNFMVKANAPKESHTYRAQLYGLSKASHNFTFSRVFPETTTQKEFFDSTMLKLVQDFIEGQNCLVFTYGVTNSGKTYTIQGNPREAGILPRGLDVLFNSISGKQWPGMDLKPRMFCDVVKLSAVEEEAERRIKENTLKLNSNEDHDVMTLLGDDASDQSVMNATGQSDISTMADTKPAGMRDSQESLISDLENRVREETTVDVAVQGQIKFSVWVSFAEIYNEQIFDLLEPIPKKKDAKRPVLKLSDDRRGSPYVKGLKEINVTSADEAYKLLTIGQRNLKTACTRLNHCSSRSHCIFNVKIIRVPDKGGPTMARVSMLSLCDLAGSERHSKTHTTGDRLKEAGNINTSLLTLGRCIELLRYNQHHKDKEKIIPFRESRLTRLFQNFFCGRGKAAMIVNVSQCASMFDETLNVFKFSAIAKQVVMPPKPAEKPPEQKRKRQTKSTRASSICWDTSVTPSRTGHASRLTSETMTEEDEEEGSDSDTAYIEQLEEHVEALEVRIKTMRRERLFREHEIRKEVCQEMQEQFVKIEDMYSNMLRQTRQEEEVKFEQKLQIVMDAMPAKRRRLDNTASTSKNIMVDSDDEWVSSLLLHQEKVKVKEHEENLAQLQKQATELEFKVADLTRKNKELESQLTQAGEAQRKTEQDCADKVAKAEALRKAAVSEVSKSSDDSILLETLGQQLQEAKDRMKQQEREINDLNEMLTDAGETFHQKEEEISKLKQVMADNEVKALQQVETIRELRALLEESKTAVEESEQKLEAKNISIGEMKDELTQLELRLKEERGVSSDDALRKAEEELAIARNRLKHEEEDFQQRHKALIHGYTAEINNLKSQMALLKSRNLGCCVATSPMKIATPEKSHSPLRHRRKGRSEKKKAMEGEEGATVDLVAQLKHLRTQLNQTSSLTPETRHLLRESWQTAEMLQQQVLERGELEQRLEQSVADLQELQGKFQELSSASTELRRQLDSKKELHTELTDNQSESAELRQKLRIAQASTDDLEGRLTAASQQALTAEADKAKIITELSEVKATMTQLEACKKDNDSELSDLQHAISSSTDRNAQLQQEVDSYKATLEACSAKLLAVSEQKQDLEDRVSSLEGQLKEHQAQALRDKEKKEELETVVAELRDMLNQASGELESKAKALENRTMAKHSMASSNETLLKEALSEANNVLQQRTEQCEYLNTQLAEGQETVADLHRQLSDGESTIDDLRTQLSEGQATISDLKAQLSEEQATIADLKTQLSNGQSMITNLQTQQFTLTDFKTQLSEGQSTIVDLKTQLTDGQSTIADLTTQLTDGQSTIADLKTQLTDGQSTIADLKTQLTDGQSTITDLKTQLTDGQSTIADLKTQLTDGQSTVADLKTQLTDGQSTIADLKTQLTDGQSTITDLKTQLTDGQSTIADLKTQLTDGQSTIADLKTQLTDGQFTIADLKTQLTDGQSTIADLKSQLSERQSSVADLKTQQSTVTDLQTQIAEGQSTIADLKTQLSKEQSTITDLKKELADGQSTITDLKKELVDGQSTITDLKKELADGQSTINDLQAEQATIADLKTSLSEEQSTIADLKTQLSEGQSSIAELRASVQKMEAKEKELGERISSQAEELADKGAQCRELQQQLEESHQLHADKQREAEALTASSRATEETLSQELEDLRVRYQSAQDALGQQEKLQSQTQQGLETKAQRAQEELAEAREALEARSKEVKALKESLAQLEQDGASELESELAQLRSSLHMHEALTKKHRDTAHSLTEENSVLEQRLHSIGLDLEKLQKENENLKAKLRQEELDQKTAEVEKAKQKETEESVVSNREEDLSQQVATLTSQLESQNQRLQLKTQRLVDLRAELKAAKAGDSEVTMLQEQLNQKTAELEKAMQRGVERQELCQKSAESNQEAELSQQVATLTSQLESQSQRLQDKTQRLADLQAELSRATQQRNIAVADVKANEQVLQQLKDAMLDQEETMEKQDTIISRRDDEIRALNSELDQLNDRCQQLLSHNTKLSQEGQTLTKVNVRLEEEKKLLARDLETLQSEVKQAVKDKETVIEKLAEKVKELSDARQAVTTEGNATQALHAQISAAQTELSKVKKACEKDTALFMEKENKLKHSVQALEKQVQQLEDKLKKEEEAKKALEKEVRELESKLQKQEESKKVWREERDKLVAQMEALMNRQAEENSTLRTQLEEDQRRYEKLVEQGRQEVQELKRELKIVTRAKDSLLTDMRHSNHQLQVELAIAQGTEPPPRPPPPQHHSFRINDSELVDDVDTTGHLEVDATPPVAAKNLRKGRKRTSALNTSSDSSSGSRKHKRRPRKQMDESLDVVEEAPELCNKMTSRLQELEEKASPITRSAQKILRLISPERKVKAFVVEPDTAPASASAEVSSKASGSKRGRGKAGTQEEIPPPFDCAPYQPSEMETRKSSRLRQRRQLSKHESDV